MSSEWTSAINGSVADMEKAQLKYISGRQFGAFVLQPALDARSRKMMALRRTFTPMRSCPKTVPRAGQRRCAGVKQRKDFPGAHIRLRIGSCWRRFAQGDIHLPASIPGQQYSQARRTGAAQTVRERWLAMLSLFFAPAAWLLAGFLVTLFSRHWQGLAGTGRPNCASKPHAN
jgi:hypothetical protein